MSRSQNPYLHWITEFDSWAKAGRSLPLGGLTPPAQPAVDQSAAKVLLFSPHPDDECITGALPLRLSREAGLQIVNVAVTLGSNKARQAARWSELQQACSFLGWPVECAAPGGLIRITPKARVEEPDHWCDAVKVIREILVRHQPQAVLFPHAADWNASHMGTHGLVLDALATMPSGFSCVLVETEFWAAMDTPNQMVESSVGDVADLVAAISLHMGEVQRNPYHLTLPAWMQDNVRRGGELVGGQGGAAPDFTFSTLYRIRCWKGGEIRTMTLSDRVVPQGKLMRDWWTEIQAAMAGV